MNSAAQLIYDVYILVNKFVEYILSELLFLFILVMNLYVKKNYIVYNSIQYVILYVCNLDGQGEARPGEKNKHII